MWGGPAGLAMADTRNYCRPESDFWCMLLQPVPSQRWVLRPGSMVGSVMGEWDSPHCDSLKPPLVWLIIISHWLIECSHLWGRIWLLVTIITNTDIWVHVNTISFKIWEFKIAVYIPGHIILHEPGRSGHFKAESLWLQAKLWKKNCMYSTCWEKMWSCVTSSW